MKRNHSLYLTPRDEGLLLDCYRNGVLSFAQIQARHFQAASPSTICNRLTRLHRAKLLMKQRLGVQLYQGSPVRIGTVYQIAKKGIGWLQARQSDQIFREDPIRLNTSSLSHDLQLSDALSALSLRFPKMNVTNGKLLKGSESAHARLPDAVLEDPRNQEKWAIELELTAKSSRRYREIITSYRLLPEYRKVLYVVSGWPLARKIQGQILGYALPEEPAYLSTGKFYFVHLKALLEGPCVAQLSNGTENLVPETQSTIAPNRKEMRS